MNSGFGEDDHITSLGDGGIETVISEVLILAIHDLLGGSKVDLMAARHDTEAARCG